MHKCKPFQDRGLHTTKLMFYLATFPNYQENGTRIASIHLSSNFSCPYESVSVSDKLVTQHSLLLEQCSSEKECGTASGDITFYLDRNHSCGKWKIFSPSNENLKIRKVDRLLPEMLYFEDKKQIKRVEALAYQ